MIIDASNYCLYHYLDTGRIISYNNLKHRKR